MKTSSSINGQDRLRAADRSQSMRQMVESSEESTLATQYGELIEVNGVLRPTRNNEGRRIYSSEEGVRNFWAWFGDSTIVDSKGRPLVVYHGTAYTGQDGAGVESFTPHTNQTIFYLDGQEIRRADSWDMGEDRGGAPDAFHYLALSWTNDVGVERSIQMVRNDVLRSGENPDSSRMEADLRRLEGRKLEIKYENRPSGDGSYFTPDKNYSFIRNAGISEGGHVIPAYLKICRPVYVNGAEIESAGRAWKISELETKGFDGAIYSDKGTELRNTGWVGFQTQIVAFRPNQIKSALGNSGLFQANSKSIVDRDAKRAKPRP